MNIQTGQLGYVFSFENSGLFLTRAITWEEGELTSLFFHPTDAVYVIIAFFNTLYSVTRGDVRMPTSIYPVMMDRGGEWKILGKALTFNEFQEFQKNRM